ncbi:MAG: response regulator [Chloroflexota bacterium]|jgi:two-component system, OmpR family, response regulator TctD
MTAKPKALIIEDNEDQNLIFTTALRQAGYATESIHNGLVAQKRLSETTPDLVVLDLHLPRVSGETLLKQIHNDRRLAHTRVILASADAALAAHLQPQVDLTLLKPISFLQLSRLAGRLLNPPPIDKPAADDSD